MVFGESVVDIGIGAEGHAVTVSLVLSAVLGLALAAALWWAYFGVGDDERAEQAMLAADPAARPALAFSAYFYPYIPMLLGVVALASGVKQAIVNTGRTLPAGPCVALGCGVALFLAGTAAFRYVLRIGAVRYRLARRWRAWPPRRWAYGERGGRDGAADRDRGGVPGRGAAGGADGRGRRRPAGGVGGPTSVEA